MRAIGGGVEEERGGESDCVCVEGGIAYHRAVPPLLERTNTHIHTQKVRVCASQPATQSVRACEPCWM